MSIKQLSNLDRIRFLLEFIGNIVQHSTEDERLKRLIKVERLKRKLIPEKDVNLEHIGKSGIFEKPSEKYQKSKTIKEFKPTFHMKRPPSKIRNIAKAQTTTSPKIKNNMQNSSSQSRPTEEIISKINKMINDKSVQMIECPGPNRNVLVKVRNKVNVTKLILNETEIKNIVTYFSDYARIPIVGGFLRTSMDQMMISAIVSDYAGSRFIINKKNPYDIIK